MRVRILALPVELHYQIILFLGVDDVLALRKTCKYFFVLTQDPGLWSTMYTCLRASQALPYSLSEFTAMSSSQAQRALSAAYKIEASFLEPRERTPHYVLIARHPYSSTNPPPCSLRVLTFISDRFLLSVNNAAVVIWDMSTLPLPSLAVASSPWAYLALSSFIGYATCDSALYIAVTGTYQEHPSVVIYSISLPPFESSEDHEDHLRPETEFPLLGAEMLKDMDPHSSRALLYSPPTSIHIVHWHENNRRLIINIQTDDLADEGWDGVTSLRFCGPYILCFRVRSVEAYPVPTDTPTGDPLPMLRHRFGPVCFRVVSLSHVRVSRCPLGQVYTVFMLTNDVYQGMFHYRIRVTTAPVPSMSVKVLAKGSVRIPEWPPLIPGTDEKYTMEEMIRRMFVSAWSLGFAGLRGVWVDRLRGSIDRRVVAFTTHPDRLRTKQASLATNTKEDLIRGGDALDASDEEPMMNGKVVHDISSYDLRDDITICAVSEWTGRIALGSRVGAILLF